MPRVEISVAEVGQKAGEAEQPAQSERPPRPRETVTKRKRGQPQIQNRYGDECPAVGDAVVKHEEDDAALRERTQLLRAHSQNRDVMRQKLSARREKQGERA